VSAIADVPTEGDRALQPVGLLTVDIVRLPAPSPAPAASSATNKP
jgi:hypothetical protein